MTRKHRETPTRRVNPSGKVVWVARYTTPQGRRVSAGTYNRKGPCDARGRSDCCAQHAIDAAHQTPAAGGAETTVGEYLPRWLKEHPVSDRTMRTNRGRIQNQLDVELEGRPLRSWPLSDLRRRHARELVAIMLTEQGRAPGGARDILRALHRLAEDAIADELADLNPWDGVRVRDDDKRALKRPREPRVWTFDEMHAFAAKAHYRPRYRPRPGKPRPASRPSPRHEPMIRLLSDCGLRLGEMLALSRSEQQLQEGMGRVVGTAHDGQVIGSSDQKNHDREFPIPPGALALLRDQPPRIDSPWLFPSPGGKLWHANNFYSQIWEPTCEAAGMNPTPHEFRHSYVSHLRAAGIDPADLADVAGQTVETATRVYTHPTRRSYDQIRTVIG